MSSRSVKLIGVDDDFTNEEGIIGDDSVDDEDARHDAETYLDDGNESETEEENGDETQTESESESESESEEETETETEIESDDEQPPLLRNDVAIAAPIVEDNSIIDEDYLVEGRDKREKTRKEKTVNLSSSTLSTGVLKSAKMARGKSREIFPIDKVEDPYRYLWESEDTGISFEEFKSKLSLNTILEIKQKCIKAWLKKVLISDNFDLLSEKSPNFDASRALNMNNLVNIIFSKLWWNCQYDPELEINIFQPIVQNISSTF